MKELLKKIYNETFPVYREHKSHVSNNYIKISYIEGAKVEIFGNQDKEYEVNFIDNDSNTNVYYTKIRPGLWSMPTPKYFVNWRIEVKCNGVVVRNDILDLKGKKIKVVCDTNSMGDLLAFIGAIDAFQKKHEAQVDCVVFNPHVRKIFENSYNNIKFLSYDHRDISYYAQYKIGYFFTWNEGWAKNDPRSVPLTSIAPSVLGLEIKEYKPKLKFEKPRLTDKKYVCIGIQSTAQCKYWNNPNGWNEVVKYLNSSGYEVWCIDKNSSFGTGEYMNYMPNGVIDKTGEFSLEERMKQLSGAEFFIGIGSGLSWLAWSVGTQVLMISGFSKAWAEFYTPYRIINENVCNGCWNNTSHKFDKSKWDWCPENKNFECSKEITPSQVINCINQIIKQDSITIITSHANTEKKQNTLVECINSIKAKVRTKIILSSNTSVPEYIQKMCDYVVYDNENPILESSDYSKYGVSYFYWHSEGNEKVFRPVPFDYGYSVYRMLKNGAGLANGLGYTKVHVLDYDYEPNDVIFSEHSRLLDSHDAVFYKFAPNKFDSLSAYLAAFFSARTSELVKITNVYKTKDEYYSEKCVQPLNLLETQFYHLASSKLKLNSKELDESILKNQIVANKMVQANSKIKNELKFVGMTENNLGIKYQLFNDGEDCDVNVKIIDSFTGLTFHDANITLNNKLIYFTAHAYKLPNQIFRITDINSDALLLERTIHTDLTHDPDLFPIENKNLINLVPKEMKMDCTLFFNYMELYLFQEYNRKKCRIEKDDIVFDIGANSGLFSRYSFLNGAKKVYSFEPNPSLWECYEKMNNGFDYTLIKKAVYSKPVKFIKKENSLHFYVEESADVSDEYININEYLHINKIEKIDYLKIDIEGAEYDLFKTIDKNYLKNNVRKIALEYHNNKNKKLFEILNILKECGFMFEFKQENGDNLEIGMLYAIK